MFHINDTAYFVRSNNQVMQVTLLHFAGGRWTVRLANGGGISLPENRLHATEEEARRAIRPRAPLASMHHLPEPDVWC